MSVLGSHAALTLTLRNSKDTVGLKDINRGKFAHGYESKPQGVVPQPPVTPKERLGQEFEQAKDRIAGATSSARQAASDDLADIRDDIARLSDTVSKLTKQVGSEISGVAGAGAVAAKEQALSFAAEAEKVVRLNPLAALAGVFFAGLLIGIMRSR